MTLWKWLRSQGDHSHSPSEVGTGTILLVMSFFLISFPLFAAEWEGRPIRQITLHLTEGSPEADVFQLIDLRPGDLYQTRLIRRTIDRLYATGKFKDIRVEAEETGEAVSIKFILVEKRTVSSIDLSGNYLVQNKEILDAIGIKPGEEFTESRWEKALSDVTALYHKKGYFQVRLNTRTRRVVAERRAIDIDLVIEEGAPARIRNVRFAGEKVYSDRALMFQMFSLIEWEGSLKGEYYRFDNLEKDLKRLKDFYVKQGYLKASVGPPILTPVVKSNEVDITIPIASSNRIDLFLEGRGPYSEDELTRFVLIMEEGNDSDEVLEESARQIEAFYRSEGYPFATVSVTAERVPEKNLAEIRFRIDSGHRVQIKEIAFTGNHTFSPNRLRRIVQLHEEGTFSRSRFTQDQLDQDAAALVQFYRAEGFRDPHVTPEARFDDAKRVAIVVFKIDAGVRTTIGEIEIKGNRALSEEKLRKALQIGPNTPYRETNVKSAADRVLSAYEKEGYLYAAIVPISRFSEDQTTADITYQIEEGNLTRLGHLSLDGNLRTRDVVLLREMAIHEGDPYSLEGILKSQRGLYRTGLFSSVRFDPVHPEEKREIQDLRLSVKERPSITLDLSLGYADYEHLKGAIEIAHRNLFGTGRSITARAVASSVEKQVSLSYREPWFFFRDTDAHLATAYIDQQEPTFRLRKLSETAGIDKSFSESLKGSLFYQYDRNRISDVDPNANLTAEDTGQVPIGSINPSFIRDTRDDPFNPRSGSVNGITIRDAAQILGSEPQFVKTTVQSSWYRGLSPKFVFAFSARAGAAFRFGATKSVPFFGDAELIPLPERFFAGGRSAVRGYAQDKLGIQGVTMIGDSPTGGNAMLIFNEELRIFLPRSIGLVLFFDHGNVWRRYTDVAFSDIKSTTGVGLRYNTPIGPFRLDWGYKLNREAGESPSELHFTLGHAF